MSDMPPTVSTSSGPQVATITFSVDKNGVYAGSGSLATPKGYQQILNTSLTSAQALTVPTGAARALIQNNGSQNARYRDDGSAPTATVGARLIAGQALDYRGPLSALQFIREADGATLDILYYG